MWVRLHVYDVYTSIVSRVRVSVVSVRNFFDNNISNIDFLRIRRVNIYCVYICIYIVTIM